MHARLQRILLGCLIALLAFTMPRYAFALDSADSKIVWGPNVIPGPGEGSGGGGGHPIDVPTSGDTGQSFDGGSDDGQSLYGVLAVAPSSYYAALVVLGVSPDDSRLTDDVRQKLSNEQYGGEFYSYARRFSRLSDLSSGTPDFYGASNDYYTLEAGFRSACVTLAKLYGKSNVWYAMYKDNDFLNAKRDLLKVLMDDDTGGDEGEGGSGGGSVTDDGEYILDPISDVAAEYSIILGFDSTCVGWIDSSENVAIEINCRYRLDGHNNVFYSGFPMIFSVPDGVVVSADGTGGQLKFTNTTDETKTLVQRRRGSAVVVEEQEDVGYYSYVTNSRFSSGNISIAPGGTYEQIAGSSLTDYSYIWAYYNGGAGSGGGGPVEGDWPDDDGTTDTPTPPTLPEPGDPTIPEPPDPTTPGPDPTPAPKPDPTGPSLPTLPDIEGGDTYTADLQGILDALDEHCIHIQTCLNSNFSSLNTYLGQIASVYTSAIVDAIYNVSESEVSAIGIARDDITQNIRNQVGWLGMDIDGNFQNLLQYLNDLWEWLEETLVFDFSGDTYDDTSLVSWLQKIYDKLGQGISTQPVDVVVDPTGTGSWLDQFLATFFGNLLANLAGVLADAAGTMATLTTKFPLSLPWDIAAILGLLVAPPVCPAFEFPCYSLTSSGLEQVGSYDVDLHDVEFAVEGIRWMMRLGFVLVLARHTKDFLELIERVID